uniref:Uncharacterized protein n=1 Tax=Arundo donax TaxID=35708 RepID=A0A0A9EDU7_ARUDO
MNLEPTYRDRHIYRVLAYSNPSQLQVIIKRVTS